MTTSLTFWCPLFRFKYAVINCNENLRLKFFILYPLNRSYQCYAKLRGDVIVVPARQLKPVHFCSKPYRSPETTHGWNRIYAKYTYYEYLGAQCFT